MAVTNKSGGCPDSGPTLPSLQWQTAAKPGLGENQMACEERNERRESCSGGMCWGSLFRRYAKENAA